LSTETEIKIKIEDPGDFRRRLGAFSPGMLSERHFEDNHLLDFPDGRLGSGQCLLRIRFTEGRHFLTFKGPPRREGVFKIREEEDRLLERELPDHEALSGRGMHLIRTIMDEVCYEQVPGGNQVRLTKRLPAGSTDAEREGNDL